MLNKYLDPKNDVAFRKIFGSEKNKDILIHFLNDMAMFKDKPCIADISFLKTVQDPEIAVKKTSLVDILCKDSKGRQYIVEMQVAPEKGFAQRAQYYAAKAYINQADVGHKYHNLREVVFLAITKFKMFPHRKNYKSDHIILEKETHDHDLTHLAFSFLELPKFKKKIHELDNITDKWMYFFKNAKETSEADLAKIIGKDSIIERAYSELNRFTWTEEELLTYEQAEKYEKGYLASLEQKFDEGLEKGKAEERQKHEEERQKHEEEKLKHEKERQKHEEEKRKIAYKMLAKGMSVEDASELTGLSIDVIESLEILA